MPKWLELRIEAKAAPLADAFPMTWPMVFLLRLKPMAPSASSTRDMGVSRSTVGWTPPDMIPFRIPFS